MKKLPLQFISDSKKQNFETDSENSLSFDWDIFDEYDEDEISVSSAGDGLIFSLRNKGRVDIEYISNICNLTKDEVIKELQGFIFQNPATWNENLYEGFETSDEYLSGNLKRKWLIAKEANEKYNNHFEINVEALEKTMPKTLATNDIYVTLGSPWLPTEIIDDFIVYLLGTVYYGIKAKTDLKTKHDTITGSWFIPNKNRYGNSYSCNKIYGTSRLNALEIIEKTLNMNTIRIYDTYKKFVKAKEVEEKIYNQDETLYAIDKQKNILNEFKNWIWADENRKIKLKNIYEYNYSSNVIRKFNGNFLKFPGMNPKYTLYPYQKDAVARILFSPNTLLAHEVGTGKTYIMIAAGMELKRMGLSKKNMYLIPNNIIPQWKEFFLILYPDANILYISPQTFKPNKRNEVLKQIRDEDYDAILIAESCFELIPLSHEHYINSIKEEISNIESVIESGVEITGNLTAKLKALKKKLLESDEQIDNNNSNICFDQLGITRLFVDEAHNYKNIKVDIRSNRVLGLSSVGAKKCENLMAKIKHIQSNNNGGGIVFATGTPISNSLTDIYAIQKYLQNGDLTLYNIQNFNSWLGMFAERSTEFEVDVDTNSYRLATRYAKFHNLPELTALLASIADFHKMDKTDDVPLLEDYNNEEIDRSNAFAEYLDLISIRADNVRSRKIHPTEDNLLKITTDGRKAALDLRLVGIYDKSTNKNSKISRCVKNVIDIYKKSNDILGTQIIFCDISTPKTAFNAYDEIKHLLLKNGIDEKEIDYIHDATSDTKKKELFEKVNNGKVRILLGSTSKLGLGVNVQKRLIAIHHLDVPWKPSDMTQREGRILRQGNINKQVYIYRYITKGSFDAYSWQLLETKQKFISALLSGSYTERSNTDIDDTVLSYAQVKALAVGNDLVRERFETENELTIKLNLQKKYQTDRYNIQNTLENLPHEINKLSILIDKVKMDIERYNSHIMNTWPKEKLTFIKHENTELIVNRLIENDSKSVITFQNLCVVPDYFGFDIIMPIDSRSTNPYIILCGTLEYKVELSDGSRGYFIRIDNRLNNLQQEITKYEKEIAMLKEKQIQMEHDLNKSFDYDSEIEMLTKKIQNIDRMLEVKPKK